MPPRRTIPLTSLAGAAVFAVLVGAYLVRVEAGLPEALRVLAGAALLWGPLALGIDFVVRREVADGAVRTAVAFGGSYALTAATFYLWSMAGVPAGFYAMQVAVVAAVAVQWWRARTAVIVTEDAERKPKARVNWLLLGLIGAALFTTAPYTKVANVTTIDSRLLRIPTDSLYFVAQTYELDREVPPRQEPTRAGTPPRSYHLLPHVSAMLLARTTGQADYLRAQIVYHLSLLTVGMSVALYALGKVLAGRRLGGYALVALLYPLAVVGRPLLVDTMIEGFFVQFYFTQFPQLSSMLDPVALGGWQSYSAVLVATTLLLVVAAASGRMTEGMPAARLLALAGVIVAALTRFRVQIYLVALPAFLLVLALVWLRRQRRAALVAGVVALAGSLPLYLEATASSYRPASAGLGLGFNGLSDLDTMIGRIRPSFIFDPWPYSRAMYDALDGWLSGAVFQWTWQIVCLTLFVFLNVIGVLGMVAAIHYFTRRAAWRRFPLFNLMVLAMTVGSLLIGYFVTSGFDSYSLSGQALFLPVWYVFPVAAVGVTALFTALQRRLPVPPAGWVALGIAVVLTGAVLRETGPETELARTLLDQRVRDGDELSADRWRTFERLREATPKDSVVISSEHILYDVFFSGIAGRAGYAEAIGDVNDDEARRIYGDDRFAIVNELWATPDARRFCALLASTPSTHLVEFSNVRLRVETPPCLTRNWVSPEGEATIWKIVK